MLHRRAIAMIGLTAAVGSFAVWWQARAKGAPPGSSAGTFATQPPPNAALDARISRLEALAARPPVQAQVPEAPSGSTNAPVAAPMSAAGETRAEYVARLLAERRERQTAFEADPPDRTFSRHGTELMQSDLQEYEKVFAQTTMHVRSVECRSTICAARLQWNNYEAVAKGPPLEAQPYHLNCATWFFPDEPQDRMAKYEATLYLDCTELRAGRAPSTEGMDFRQGQVTKSRL